MLISCLYACMFAIAQKVIGSKLFAKRDHKHGTIKSKCHNGWKFSKVIKEIIQSTFPWEQLAPSELEHKAQLHCCSSALHFSAELKANAPNYRVVHRTDSNQWCLWSPSCFTSISFSFALLEIVWFGIQELRFSQVWLTVLTGLGWLC